MVRFVGAADQEEARAGQELRRQQNDDERGTGCILH
jgi:hypothetical protein